MNKKVTLILIITIILVVLVAVPLTTYAIYISKNNHNTTIVAGSVRSKFSGDFLHENELLDSDPPMLARTYKEDNIQLAMFNHPYGIDSEYNARDVKYKITFKITSPNVLIPPIDDNYSIKIIGDTQYFVDKQIVFENQTLSGGEASTITYSIKVPELTIIEIKAEPNNPDLPTLYGRIQRVIVSDVGKPVTIAWAGEFNYNEGLMPGQYSGFVYQITGSGVGTYTLSWDHTKLAIDEYSFEDITHEESTEGDYTSYIFHVDSAECGKYNIRFFLLEDFNTWADVENCIDNESCYVSD